MTPEQAQYGRMAVEIMATWTADADNANEVVPQHLNLLMQEGATPVEAAVQLIYGFVNLTGLLLVQRLAEQGTPEEQTLQEIALRFAQ